MWGWTRDAYSRLDPMVWARLKQSTHNPADPKEETIPTGYQKSEARGRRHTRDVIESGEGTEGRLVMANEKSGKEKRKLGDQPLKVLRTFGNGGAAFGGGAIVGPRERVDDQEGGMRRGMEGIVDERAWTMEGDSVEPCGSQSWVSDSCYVCRE